MQLCTNAILILKLTRNSYSESWNVWIRFEERNLKINNLILFKFKYVTKFGATNKNGHSSVIRNTEGNCDKTPVIVFESAI